MIRDVLVDALRQQLVALGAPEEVVIGLEQPAHREHGDWSSNVALTSAKLLGRPPREIATELAERLTVELPAHVVAVGVAGPGFVNFTLSPSWLHQVLAEVIEEGEHGYARPSLGSGVRVLVEFVSANPTGPLHAGHARGAAYGDSLARILDHVGYDVSREFYINDRGTQMARFGESIAARAAGAEPPEGGYLGDYIRDWAVGLTPDDDPVEFGYERALADQREVLEAFGVRFDTWFSERSMIASGVIDKTLADLRARGVVDDRDGAVWLRSTDFGDDKDRVLVKADGEPTYLLPDIGYHRDKFARGFELLIDVWGADHHGYIPRMRAAIEALGHDASQFEPVITQLVRLVSDGEEVRISKRSGDIIELRDLIEEVGADATRLTYLLQSIDSPQTVDLDLVKSTSMENPVFYVQMAHARLCSLARTARERGFDGGPFEAVDTALLVHERELELLRTLESLGAAVEMAARDRAPHKVTTWVRELAGAVHGWYHDCPVLRDDVGDDLRRARLWLAEGALVGLRIGLGLLGVSAPESM